MDSGPSGRKAGKGATGQTSARKARLAEELRANLQRRKAQSRSRRTGEADERPEGLAGSSGRTSGEGKRDEDT